MKEEKSKLLQALEAKVKELTCGGMCIAYSGDDAAPCCSNSQRI